MYTIHNTGQTLQIKISWKCHWTPSNIKMVPKTLFSSSKIQNLKIFETDCIHQGGELDRITVHSLEALSHKLSGWFYSLLIKKNLWKMDRIPARVRRTRHTHTGTHGQTFMYYVLRSPPPQHSYCLFSDDGERKYWVLQSHTRTDGHTYIVRYMYEYAHTHTHVLHIIYSPNVKIRSCHPC